MLQALRGELSVRQLRVMVDNLDLDRPLSRATGGGRWLEQDWLLHDVDTVLRKLAGAYLSVNRAAGEPAVDLGVWPSPDLDADAVPQVDEEQLAAEAQLHELMHSGG